MRTEKRQLNAIGLKTSITEDAATTVLDSLSNVHFARSEDAGPRD